MPHRQSIGKLLVNGAPKGTAWMITPNLALTANHCFRGAPAGAELKVRFGLNEHIVQILESDAGLDIALLSFAPGAVLPVNLKLLARPAEAMQPGQVAPIWGGFGYPPAINEGDGFTMSGKVDDLRWTRYGQPAVQLTCEQVTNRPDFNKAFLGGFSGGPAFAHRDDVSGVFGVILEAPPELAEKVISAVPVEAIIERFPGHLNVPVKSWDAITGRVVITQGPGTSVRSNVSFESIDAMWRNRIGGMWCNLEPDIPGALPGAVARLLLHARATGTPVLNLEMPIGWRDKVRAAGKNWIHVEAFKPDALIGGYAWNALNGAVPVDGTLHADANALAHAIHQYCDLWILRELRTAMIGLLEADSTVEQLRFAIARDLREQMGTLWATWHQQLQANPVLLHHFLALLMTEVGDYDTTTPSGGAGTVTLFPCLLRALAFSLAVCSCKTKISALKHPAPGNVGTPTLSGHVCGIGLFNGQLLHLGLGSHQWATSVVLIPNCPERWEQIQSTEARFDKVDGDASLRRDPPRNLVLTGDRELLTALGVSRDAFGAKLEERCKDFAELQQSYAKQSKPNA